jgi:NTE family protein
MNTTSSHSSRALVLAGAGAAGNAWQLGLVAGLAEAGVDLTAADLVIGTSSGSTAAAQLTSGTLPVELYAAIIAQAAQLQAARPHSRQMVATAGNYMEWSQAIIDSSADAAEMRRRIGAAALDRDADNPTAQEQWRTTVAARLSSHDWPEQLVHIVAVDAETGEPAVLDRHSGMDLVDAVAASTSNGFTGTYRVGDHRYINGGYRRNENADLAAGYARVIVLAPFSGRVRQPAEWNQDLASQVAELRDGGSEVETVFPDTSAGDVFNVNAMDPATRLQAAQGGHAQGLALAATLRELWT